MKKKYFEIIWRDITGINSANNSSSWFTKTQILKEAQTLFCQQYTSVGEIVGETKDWVVIAATCDNDKENPLYSDASMIPKSVIIKIRPL